jgi:predicted aldo/keto reductase-like oxidoreductase
MEQVILAAIDDGRFDLVLFVHNFLQKEAGERILEAAAAKNVATTIMKSNPLGRYFDMKQRAEQMRKDGQPLDERMTSSLAEMEETVKKAESFLQKNGLKTPAEIKAAALKFVLGDPRVHTLNLAFNTFDDVRDGLALSGTALRPAEKSLLSAYESECGRLYCRHACGICESSCPHAVPVNTIMRYSHYFVTQGSEKFAMEKYAGLRTAKADLCRDCPGLCESSCPYGVPVQGLLNLAHAQLTLDERPFV